MEIAALNQKITIQKNEVLVDAVGNHVNGWNDYFTCYATISGEDGSSESEAAGQISENSKCSFTVRWCSELSQLNSTQYRVVFCGNFYNITGVNHQGYKKHSIKIACQKCRR